MMILVAGLVAGCAAPSSNVVLGPPRDVGVAEAKALVAAGQAVPIDMRSPHEYASGHIPGAVLVPFGSPKVERMVRKAMGDRQALVYCRIGKRSGISLQELSGIPGVLHLTGGIAAWKEAGGALEQTAAGPMAVERKTEVYRFF